MRDYRKQSRHPRKCTYGEPHALQARECVNICDWPSSPIRAIRRYEMKEPGTSKRICSTWFVQTILTTTPQSCQLTRACIRICMRGKCTKWITLIMFIMLKQRHAARKSCGTPGVMCAKSIEICIEYAWLIDLQSAVTSLGRSEQLYKAPERACESFSGFFWYKFRNFHSREQRCWVLDKHVRRW